MIPCAIALKTIGILLAAFCMIVMAACCLAALIDWSRRMTAVDPSWTPGPEIERNAIHEDAE